MSQLVKAVPRALWVGLALLVLLATIVPVQAVSAASTSTYTLVGYVYQPGNASTPVGAPVPAGVQVDLVSRATNQTYTTTTGTPTAPNQFRFSSSSNAPALTPGWWGVWVPIQGNLSLGPSCTPCGVVPRTVAPNYAYESSSALGSGNPPVPLSVYNVTLLPYSSRLNGTVTSGGRAGAALVQVLDPAYGGFVLASRTTFPGNGSYLISVPEGTWEVQTTLFGTSPRYNTTEVRVTRPEQWLNISVRNYLVSGFEYTKVNGATQVVPTGGNLTVYNPATGALYTGPITGGFYSFGTYPANFTSGPQSFDVFLSSINYTTAFYAVTVTGNTPISRNVYVTAQPPPASYTTTLNFTGLNLTRGSGGLTVKTAATLGPNAVLSDLANASVGDLWSQLGLDYNHSISTPSTLLSTIAQTINSTGPFFPAVQSGTTVNGTAFNEPAGTPPFYRFAYTSNCASFCGPNSTSSIFLNYSSSYSLSSTLYGNASSYTLSFQFRYPTHEQSFVYSILLPQGYALQAGATAPAYSSISATGKGHTWTAFTLSPQSNSPTSSGTATFTLVKYGGVHAVVNVTTQNFTFSKANVLNQSSGSYTVVVGQHQNLTFSAINSTYPLGTNGSYYVWYFGDGNHSQGTQPTASHWYNLTATFTKPLQGNLTVTSSGGLKNSVQFFVWVIPAGLVKANISYNATGREVRTTTSGTKYLFVNWSTSIQFNATGSSANVGHPAVPSVLSIAAWNWSTYGYYNTGNNFSVAGGLKFGANWTLTPTGMGRYYSSTVIGGDTISFLGWQYNVTLTVWDGEGHHATTKIIVLVNDTQKPSPVIILLNPNGKVVPSSGVIENNVAGLTNGTAKVIFSGANSTDPGNGSIASYSWRINNTKNLTKATNIYVNQTVNQTTFKYPGTFPLWLTPQLSPYTVNLTVSDRAGNVFWTTTTLMVNVNTTTRPILAANNLTAPGTMTAGTAYTIWVNVTVQGGSKAVAQDVRVNFYILPPSGSGSPNYIVSSTSVQFYNYSKGVVNTVPFATGVIGNLSYGTTVRAVISWTPGPTGISLLGGGNIGNWYLYANATASNEFAPDYHGGPNLISIPVTVVQSPISTYVEIGIIVVVAVVIVLALVLFLRRRSRRRGAVRAGRGGLERGSRRRDNLS